MTVTLLFTIAEERAAQRQTEKTGLRVYMYVCVNDMTYIA